MKTYIDAEVCKMCGGQCCKRLAGCYLPGDFGDPPSKRIITRGFTERMLAIDWWEGGVKGNERGLFLRPAHVGVKKLRDPSWGGVCVFLSANGCTLPYDDRPSGCKMLEPVPDPGHCKVHGAGKEEAALAWGPFVDTILECERKARNGK